MSHVFSSRRPVYLPAFLALLAFILVLSAFQMTAQVSAQEVSPLALEHTYSQQTSFGADDGVGKGFGVKFAVDGDVALVGAHLTDSEAGAAYIYVRQNGAWTKQQKLLPNDPAANNWFGWSVALKGDMAFVGAPGAFANAKPGAVYIFMRQNDIWTQQQKLTVTGAGLAFGWALALDNDVLLASQLTDGGSSSLGAVYTFMRQDTTWVQQQKLVSGFTEPQDMFGFSLVAENGTAFIYAFNEGDVEESNSALYTFVRSGNNWTKQQQFLLPSSSLPLTIGLSGDLAIIGIGSEFNQQGAVQWFQRKNGIWTAKSLFQAPVPEAYKGFGAIVALKNGLAAVSTFEQGQPGNVFLYSYADGEWNFQQELNVDGTASANTFGNFMAFSGQYLMVGAADINNPRTTDKVFVFSDPALAPTNTPVPPTATPTNIPPTTIPPTNVPSTPVPPTETPDEPETAFELLVNGGFEDSTEGWTLKNATSDKAVCNNPEKVVAAADNCAFQFKGGVEEQSSLQQKLVIDAAGRAVEAGGTLTLDGMVNATGAPNSKVTLKVKYVNEAIPADKLTVTVDTKTDKVYVPFSALESTLSLALADTPGDIKLQIKNTSASGKIRYDALSVLWQPSGTSAFTNSRGEILPLPVVK